MRAIGVHNRSALLGLLLQRPGWVRAQGQRTADGLLWRGGANLGAALRKQEKKAGGGEDRRAYPHMLSSPRHLSNITNKAGRQAGGLCSSRIYSAMKRQVQILGGPCRVALWDQPLLPLGRLRSAPVWVERLDCSPSELSQNSGALTDTEQGVQGL